MRTDTDPDVCKTNSRRSAAGPNSRLPPAPDASPFQKGDARSGGRGAGVAILWTTW
jgi:hypothetical protein